MGLIELLIFIISLAIASEPAIHFRWAPRGPEGSVVSLKDVAEVKGVPKAVAIELEEMVLALSPQEYRALSKIEIAKKVRQEAATYEKDCQCQLQFIFSGDAKPLQTAQHFSLQQVEKELLAKLKKNCTDCVIEMKPLVAHRGEIPSHFSKWHLQEDLRNLRGPALVRVYFDEQMLNPLILQTWIRLQKPVFKSRRPLMKGHILTTNDYELTLRDITEDQRPYATLLDFQGRELKRSLNESQMITLDDLVEKQNVKLGEIVSLEMQNGSIFLEMSGTAQKGGKMGDRIPVRIHKTQKLVMAEIIGDSRVRFQ